MNSNSPHTISFCPFNWNNELISDKSYSHIYAFFLNKNDAEIYRNYYSDITSDLKCNYTTKQMYPKFKIFRHYRENLPIKEFSSPKQNITTAGNIVLKYWGYHSSLTSILSNSFTLKNTKE